LTIFSSHHTTPTQTYTLSLHDALPISREPEVETREGTRVRIFTVEEELPFAGHPTLGTALYLYPSSEASDQIVLDLNVGKIPVRDRKSTRLNSSHVAISYAVFCLKKKK